MEREKKNMASPLLEPVPSKRASKLQTLGNIIVTVVGTGVLGLPFAFRIAGWVAGSLGVAVVGLSTYYCMLLLVGDSIVAQKSLFFLYFNMLEHSTLSSSNSYVYFIF